MKIIHAIAVSLFLASCAAVPPKVEPPKAALPDDLILVCYEGYWVVASQSADKAVMFGATCGPQA